MSASLISLDRVAIRNTRIKNEDGKMINEMKVEPILYTYDDENISVGCSSFNESKVHPIKDYE